MSWSERYKRFTPGDKLVVPPRVAVPGDRVEIWHEPKYGYPKIEPGEVVNVELDVGERLFWRYRVRLDRKTKPRKFHPESNPIIVSVADLPASSWDRERGKPDECIRRLEE